VKLIKFRRIPLVDGIYRADLAFTNEQWEIAFSERELHMKLEGNMAEVKMPAKPWFVRLWRKLFPLKFKEISIV
jgi:hypothetical protein